MTRDRLQPGIYFRPGEKPPPAYRLVLLDARAGASRVEVGAALEAVTAMLRALPRGEVRDLPGAKRRPLAEQFAGLTALLGLGASLFARGFTRAERPEHLVPLAGFPPCHGRARAAVRPTSRFSSPPTGGRAWTSPRSRSPTCSPTRASRSTSSRASTASAAPTAAAGSASTTA